ncbi:MAG: hypothetical protein Q7T44_02485 [Parvibaculum sp.]|nr:hypothetical protein [Parvibaculum sp.]
MGKQHNTKFRHLHAMSFLIAASLALAACSGGGEARKRDANGNIVPTARDLDPAATRYSDTMDAAKEGDCSDVTLSLLTCYAYRGHGYEGAQTALGQCHMKEKNPTEGLTWLTRAADSGWPEAQKALAMIYLDGKGVEVDSVEGGKWAALYRKNPSLLSLGVQPDKKLAEKVSAKLDDIELSEANRRASAWVAKFWKPETALDARTAATCYVSPRRQYQRPEINMGDDMSEY